MDSNTLRKQKIIFIKEELKKFSIIKRKCKYAYKNWYRTAKNIVWKSPKFKEMNDNYYFSHYGKFYITCLHILYNKITHEKNYKQHTIKVNENVYSDSIKTIDIWIEEKIKYKEDIK